VIVKRNHINSAVYALGFRLSVVPVQNTKKNDSIAKKEKINSDRSKLTILLEINHEPHEPTRTCC